MWGVLWTWFSRGFLAPEEESPYPWDMDRWTIERLRKVIEEDWALSFILPAPSPEEPPVGDEEEENREKQGVPGKSRKDRKWLRDYLHGAGKDTYRLVRSIKKDLPSVKSDLELGLSSHAVTYGSPTNYEINTPQYEVFATIKRLLREMEEVEKRLPKMLELAESLLRLSEGI